MIPVFVQAAPGREEAWARSKASIEASDIGTNYERRENPPDVHMRDHFMNLLREMSECEADLMIRLEDDAIVNRHILHNVKTWPDVNLSDFGCGWLFAPGRQKGRWDGSHIHASIGVVFRKDRLPAIIQRCEKWFERRGGQEQDLALSRSVWLMEKRVYIHDPPLVEHPLDVPSAMGHQHTILFGTTSGRFKIDWRR